MYKKEIIDTFAAQTGRTKKDAELILEEIVEFVCKSLADDKTIQIKGFMDIGTKEWAARTGFNPRTHAKIDIASKKFPVIKAGIMLKDCVNQ